MWTECKLEQFSATRGALNLAWEFIIRPSRETDKCKRGEREKNVQDCRREKGEKTGRQSQVLITPCLSLLLLQCLWFIRGYDGWAGCRGQVWHLGRRRERGRAGDWFVIVVLALWCTVSACSPFNSGHRKSNTIPTSACNASAPMSLELFFIETKKQQLSCLKRWRKERGGGRCHLRPLGGTSGTKNLFTFLSSTFCQEMLIWLPLSLSLSPSFPSTTGLDYITMHSLTHLLPCAPVPADG